MTVLEIVGVLASLLVVIGVAFAHALRGRILCALGWHKWGHWRSYQLGDLERMGKPRTYRWCMRFGCESTQDGPVCKC